LDLRILFIGFDLVNMLKVCVFGEDGRKLLEKEKALWLIEFLSAYRDRLPENDVIYADVRSKLDMIIVANRAVRNLEEGFANNHIKDVMVSSLNELQQSIADTLMMHGKDTVIDVHDANINILKSIPYVREGIMC